MLSTELRGLRDKLRAAQEEIKALKARVGQSIPTHLRMEGNSCVGVRDDGASGVTNLMPFGERRGDGKHG